MAFSILASWDFRGAESSATKRVSRIGSYTLTEDGSPTWDASGVTCDTNGQRLYLTLPSEMKFASNFWVMSAHYRVWIASANTTMFGLVHNDADSDPFSALDLFATSDYGVNLRTNSAGTGDGTSAGSVTDSVEEVWTLKRTQTAATAYLASTSKATLSPSTWPAYDATAHLALGCHRGVSRTTRTRFHWLLVGTGDITTTEMATIQASPNTYLYPAAPSSARPDTYADGAILAGATSVSLVIPLPAQTTDATAGVKVAYTRTGAATQTSTAQSNTATGAHTDWSIVPCDPTHIPALHRVDLPDAAFAAGADAVTLSVSATGMAAQHFTYRLVPPVRLAGLVAATSTTTSVASGLTSYGTNQLARRLLEFTGGDCAGQRVAIVGNTSGGVLEVAPPLTTAPAVDDPYFIH